ncbi:MAG: clostripain-related cysteine peptidase [Bdellovibrionota bacterium]
MRKNLAVLIWSLSFLSLSLLGGAPTAHADGDNNPDSVKDWTILVYLNGHNNLDDFGALNINQMETMGSNEHVNIVVQWASLANGKTRRLLVKKDNDTTKVTSPVIEEIPAVDMGDYNSLVEFAKWGAAHYPAKHYFIDVWDHGGGWHLPTVAGSVMMASHPDMHGNDISWDDNTGHFITTQQFGQALAKIATIFGHKIDLVGTDACLMAMAEVAREISDSVEIFSGSEETEPGAGWPYDTILHDWYANPSATAVDIAKIITKNYVASYDGKQEATFSSFDLSHTSDVVTAVAKLGKKFDGLTAAGKKKALKAATATQAYTYNDYLDLGDLLANLKKSRVPSVDAALVEEVNAAITGFVIANADTANFAKSKGVSIWFPTAKDTYDTYADKYQPLIFNHETGWGDSLKKLLQ